MRYYVTIYVDTLFEKELLKNVEFSLMLKGDFAQAKKQIDFTHAFLGLTKGKSPDELDKIKLQRDIKYWDYSLGKMVTFRREEYKWYESLETNEYNDGFWGFGTGTDSVFDVAGKVFENNQYVMDNNTDENRYIVKKLRSSNTFNPSNRCILELSQEQYETLLQNIHKDYQITIEVKPQTKQYKNDEYRYHITQNNCVHWVQKQLRMIGIEVFEKFDIPGSFMDIFDSIREVHSIFLQFQHIDLNLESVKGATTFRQWVDELVGNKYLMCSLNKETNKIRKDNLQCEVNNQDTAYTYWTRRKEKLKIYQRLKESLDALVSKSNKKLKGVFNFLYVSNNKGYMLSPPNYKAQTIDTLDLTIPANNFSVSEFYPFIFVPDDEMIARILYHEYDYATLSANYIKDTMEFYYAFLEGREIKEYWSEAFHAINKRVKDEYRLA